MSFKESFIDTSTRVFSPITNEARNAEYQELIKRLAEYPGDLTNKVLKFKKEYDEMYMIGQALELRYHSAKVDIETLRDENRLLERENKKLNDVISNL